MKIIVHAGMHKTATTAVQAWLQGNRAQLEQAGILISVHGPRLLNGTSTPDARHQFSEDMKMKERQGYHTLITSSEIFSLFDQTRSGDLLSTLSGHKTKLILCFRHWTGFLPSRWQQNCYRRDTMAFGEFLNRMLYEGSARFGMRMDLVLRNLRAEDFDEVGVLSYDNALASSGGVTPCVLNAMGVPDHLICQLAEQPEYINRTSQKIRADEMRLLNGIWAKYLGLPQNEMFEKMGRHMPVEDFFDLARCWSQISGSFPELKTEVSHHLDHHMNSVVLKSSSFAGFAAALETACDPYLLNRSDGEMFHDIADTTVTCSDLEHSMLPKDLRSDIIDAILAAKERRTVTASRKRAQQEVRRERGGIT